MKHPPIPYSLKESGLLYSLSGDVEIIEIPEEAPGTMSGYEGFECLLPSLARHAENYPQSAELGI